MVGGVGVALRATALVDLGVPVERTELTVDGGLGETVVAQRVLDLDRLESAAIGGLDLHLAGDGRGGNIWACGPVPEWCTKSLGGILVLCSVLGRILVGELGGGFDQALLHDSQIDPQYNKMRYHTSKRRT